MRRFLRDQFVFYGQVLKEFDEVGAFSATSRFVAKAVGKGIHRNGSPIKVLEVGAGTGSLTEGVFPRLNAHDTFDIVEINPVFAEHMRKTYVDRPGGPRVRVHAMNVEHVDLEDEYDVIVSSLPLLNMDPDVVQNVFKLYFDKLKPEGSLIYYDYWAKGLRRFVTPAKRQRERMKNVLQVTRAWVDRYEVDRTVVVRNVWPACVHYLRPRSLASV
ncbi:MAG: class I SAM-dependent methyltransferase [Planctomycetes bacterium]|nr:class I SAM-dependent methyltransferase [Planctomycetota bacterium]